MIPREETGFFGSGGLLNDAVAAYTDTRLETKGVAFLVYAQDIIVHDDSFLGPVYSHIEKIPRRSGMETYTIKKGDTVAGLAAKFGLPVETIVSANGGVYELKERKKISIPNISGTVYKTNKEDTIEIIAEKFNVSAEGIKAANPGYEKILKTTGGNIVIPKEDEEREIIMSEYSENQLPFIRGFFALPAKGWNWGRLHSSNAVDIANVCGSPIYASATGIVIEESSEGSWNDGYGNYILIEHENKTQTRYAHNAKNLVEVGDVVLQGKKIALMGNTGNTQGITGCHVHFEVYGARNPFAL